MKILLYILGIFLFIFLLSCNSFQKNVTKLKSEESINRAEAIYWLSENSLTATTQKLLIEALNKDESEVVRSLVARIIAVQKNPEYIPLLVRSLSDKSPLVRMEVAQSLGTLQAKSAIPDLLKVLEKDTEVLVRLKVLKSINYMDAKETVPNLIEMLEDHEPSVRFQALQLLERFCQVNVGLDRESWKKWYEAQNKKS